MSNPSRFHHTAAIHTECSQRFEIGFPVSLSNGNGFALMRKHCGVIIDIPKPNFSTPTRWTAVSRYGRLAVVCQYTRETAPNEHLPEENDFKERLRRAVGKTGGKGMTALTRDGWFRPRTRNKSYPNLPIGYLLDKRVKLESVRWPEPEDSFNGIRGEGSAAEIEYLQWGWLNRWDNFVRDESPAKSEPDSVFLHKSKNVTNDEVLKWPLGDDSRHVIKNLRNDLKSKDQRLVTALLGDEILLRWKDPVDGRLAKLHRLMDCDLCIENAKRVCCTHVFSPEDLFIFKQCADRALVQDLFNDTGFFSHIIYVSILAKEFVDHQQTLQKYLETFPDAFPDATDNIKNEWNALKDLYEKIDREMETVYAHIAKDYRSYIESSEFLKISKKELDLKKVKKRWTQDLHNRKRDMISPPTRDS